MELRSGEVVGGERHDAGFVLELADGSREAARRVLLATGMDYRYPALPGIAERWGRSVFHCPFCHGWEVRDQPLGVLDRGASGVQRALLLRVWSDDVTLLRRRARRARRRRTRERLRGGGRRGRRAPRRRAARPGRHADGGRLRRRRASAPCGGLLVPVTLHQRSALAEQLGAAAAEPGPLAADAVEVDPMFHTSVPGLFAAGDASAQMPSVANAVAAGSTAAAMIVARPDGRGARPHAGRRQPVVSARGERRGRPDGAAGRP